LRRKVIVIQPLVVAAVVGVLAGSGLASENHGEQDKPRGQAATGTSTFARVGQDYARVDADFQRLKDDCAAGKFDEALSDLDRLVQDQLQYYSDVQVYLQSDGSAWKQAPPPAASGPERRRSKD
jgi:hypothetical protein